MIESSYLILVVVIFTFLPLINLISFPFTFHKLYNKRFNLSFYCHFKFIHWTIRFSLALYLFHYYYCCRSLILFAVSPYTRSCFLFHYVFESYGTYVFFSREFSSVRFFLFSSFQFLPKNWGLSSGRQVFLITILVYIANLNNFRFAVFSHSKSIRLIIANLGVCVSHNNFNIMGCYFK